MGLKFTAVMDPTRGLRVILLAAGWLMTSLLIAGCDPMTAVTFVNATQAELQFYTQSDVQEALLSTRRVPPGSSLEYGMISADYAWIRFAATRQDGHWVFDRKYSRDELENAIRQRASLPANRSNLEGASLRVVGTVACYKLKDT